MTVELSPVEIRCLGVLAQLAERHPDTLQELGEAAGLEPVDLMGLVMKLESLLEEDE